MRSASREVSRSPSITPGRAALRSRRSSRVFSSSVVFPQPGEPMRLRTSSRCSANRFRFIAAMRSLASRTF